MGATVSIGLRKHIETEFAKNVKKDSKGVAVRDYLVLDEVLRLQGTREHSLDLTHVGTLFVLDRSLDGKFTEKKLLDFVEVLCAREFHKTSDFRTSVEGFCTIVMWREVGKPDGGQQTFVRWMTNLFAENQKPVRFTRYPDAVFFISDSFRTLHEILNVRAKYGLDFQAFFDLVQRVAEANGWMPVEDSALDDYADARTLDIFAEAFISGFTSLMIELGFEAEMSV